MTRREPDRYKPFSEAFPHWGAVCKLIREVRGVDVATIAAFCEVSETTISRNLEQEGRMRPSNFERYLAALQSTEVMRRRPLKDPEAQIIRAWYTNRHAVAQARLQDTFAAVSFTHIVEGSIHDDQLAWLIGQLEQERRPALIMDDLWFVHALNGALLHLFELEHRRDIDKVLSHWPAWHCLGVKFVRYSQARKSYGALHGGEDPMLPASMKLFFEDRRTYPYLFTKQMGLLIDRLLRPSEDEAYQFHEWLYQVLSFSLPYRLRALPRMMAYRGKPIQVQVASRHEIQAEVSKGYNASYRLSVWKPIGADARRVFAEIEDHTIYYAATYDTEHKFHVNNWPEVQQLLDNGNAFFI